MVLFIIYVYADISITINQKFYVCAPFCGVCVAFYVCVFLLLIRVIAGGVRVQIAVDPATDALVAKDHLLVRRLVRVHLIDLLGFEVANKRAALVQERLPLRLGHRLIRDGHRLGYCCTGLDLGPARLLSRLLANKGVCRRRRRRIIHQTLGVLLKELSAANDHCRVDKRLVQAAVPVLVIALGLDVLLLFGALLAEGLTRQRLARALLLRPKHLGRPLIALARARDRVLQVNLASHTETGLNRLKAVLMALQRVVGRRCNSDRRRGNSRCIHRSKQIRLHSLGLAHSLGLGNRPSVGLHNRLRPAKNISRSRQNLVGLNHIARNGNRKVGGRKGHLEVCREGCLDLYGTNQ